MLATSRLQMSEHGSQGLSKGKGTTGVMKRWGFKGGPKSHGATKFHRKGGSIGSVGPARVLKGRKMAGRSGAAKVTAFNLQVGCWRCAERATG